MLCLIAGMLPFAAWQLYYNALRTGSPFVPAVALPQFAGNNGTTLVDCSCATGSADAVVSVERTFSGLLLVPGTLSLQAHARAVVDLP